MSKKTTVEELAKDVVRVLDEMGSAGCRVKSWDGFQNGNGRDIGKHIDRLIRKAKKVIK